MYITFCILTYISCTNMVNFNDFLMEDQVQNRQSKLCFDYKSNRSNFFIRYIFANFKKRFCSRCRCPGDSEKCLLGSVLDPCKCCANGICARLDGESCWNSSIPGLPPRHRNDGQCARNYECRLRTDLREQVRQS